ncbi:unnamed protein product, partial [Prorocentrum cordatum]
VWQVQGESLEPLKQWVLDPVTAEFTGDGQLGSVSSYDTRLSNGMLRLSDGFLQTYDIICDKVEAWLQYEEPPGTRCIDKTVRNRWFEYICLIVIAGHAVFMLFAADYEVQHRHIDNSDGNIVYVVSLCFTIWYSIELLLKLLSHRQYFFCGPDVGWNMFDLCLVTFAILDHLPASIGDDVTFLRSLRTLRIARTLRILRMVRFLKELRLLMKCILSSFLSSFWCIAFMVFVMYMFALYQKGFAPCRWPLFSLLAWLLSISLVGRLFDWSAGWRPRWWAGCQDGGLATCLAEGLVGRFVDCLGCMVGGFGKRTCLCSNHLV